MPESLLPKTKDSALKAENCWRQQKTEGYKMRCKADLYNIISLLQVEYHSGYIPKSKFLIIEPAVNHINENYALDSLSIVKLAEMCDITPEYFRRIFRERFGTSPLHYINEMRLTRAKELLASGMYSVSEVAVLCGYTEACYFSREFKKRIGVSPKDYI
jgi:AraC-like DNA-binding protein